jgi:hypothetical protein
MSADSRLYDEDIEQAEDLMDKISEQNYNMNKLNELMTNELEDDTNDEDLLKELTDEYETNDPVPDQYEQDPVSPRKVYEGEDPVYERNYEEEKHVFA